MKKTAHTLKRWIGLILLMFLAHAPASAEGFSVGARFGLDYPFMVGAFAQYETNLGTPTFAPAMGVGFGWRF
jgi:hypothetical protein